MPRLVVEKGNDRGKVFVIPPKGATVFGRDNSATIQIKDTMASRMHFKIEGRDDGFWLVDLESMNGTLLNGHPAKEAKLAPGDLIKLGESLFSFLGDEAAVDGLVGQRIGGYRILERIGRGGMGTVYKAEQIDLQRHVALKIISEEHSKKKDFVELFVHEARAAAKLNHPNIVQVYDVKKANDLYYFSMEYVPGGSVQELLNKQRKVDFATAVRMILDAARGLEYAHKKEIIHRDVKPDNFMIGEGGAIKIGDLGLAQRLGEKLSADDENSVIGTPHYIAPEQVLGRPADYRSDIYALGSTMYRMIAGFTPFQAPSVRDLVNKKAREDATPLAQACADVPARLSEICAKMMARNPDQRYQSLGETIVDLEKYVRDSTGQQPPDAGTALVAVGNRRLLVAAVALLAVVLLGGVVGAIWVMNRPPDPLAPSPTATPVPDDDRGAEAKMDLARTAELKLDAKKPEDIQEVIKLFAEVSERWPASPFAAEAQQRKAALEQRLREFRAEQQLLALDESDKNAWAQILQTFQAGREDLTEADRSILAYQNFSQDEAHKGTPAAAKAGAWADRLLEWKSQVQTRRAALETVRAEANADVDKRRFQAAWERYNRFVSDTLAIKLDPTDRYNSLLYESIARKLQERLVETDRVAWYEIEKQTKTLEAAGQYRAAMELCDPVVRDSTSDPRRFAQIRQKELQEKWTEQKVRAEQLLAEEIRRKEEEDLRDFEDWARKWRSRVVAFDAKAAADDAARISALANGSFPRSPSTAERLRRRATELRLVADLRDAFIKAWSDTKGGVPRPIDLGTLAGTLVRVTEKMVVVKIQGGGEAEFGFADIARNPDTAGRFLTFLRGFVREPDSRWNCGLAVYAFELGQWERAAELLRVLDRVTDEEVKRFVAFYKPMAEEGRYHDADEVEAQKHLDRLEGLAKDLDSAARIDAAIRECAYLAGMYAKTRVATDKKARIEELRKLVESRGGEDAKRRKKEADYRKIQTLRSTHTGYVRERDSQIYTDLGKLPDKLERNYHTAEAYFAYREHQKSSNTLRQLLEDLMGAAARRQPEVTALLARGSLAAARNAVLRNDPAGAGVILAKATDALKEQNREPDWWTGLKGAHAVWMRELAEHQKRWGDRLEKLEEALQDAPEAGPLWDLAQGREVLRDYLEARVQYSVLIEMFPDHERVRNGDALWRLAETCWQFRDLADAKKWYTKLQNDHPNHRKVKGRDSDGTYARLVAIADLEGKTGASK